VGEQRDHSVWVDSTLARYISDLLAVTFLTEHNCPDIPSSDNRHLSSYEVGCEGSARSACVCACACV
jgi:hypothetical protein